MTTTSAAMKREELLSDFPPVTSQRYACLQTVVHKALQASQRHFDVDTAMTAVYGEDDVKSFGKETLRVFFDSALEKIQQQVVRQMDEYSHAEDIPAQLLKLEAVAAKLERQTEWAQFREDQDHTAAQSALKAIKLPAGYATADEVVQAHIYHQLTSKCEALTAELEALEQENERLRQQEESKQNAFQEQQPNVVSLVTEMEKAADVTSTITK